MSFTLEQLKQLRDMLDEKIAGEEEKLALPKDPNQHQQPAGTQQLPFQFIPTSPYMPITINIPTTPLNWDANEEEFCSIRQYFKDHPEATSVMMVCHCRRCSVWCSSNTTTIGSLQGYHHSNHNWLTISNDGASTNTYDWRGVDFSLTS